jgi:hypothetical protein
MHQCPRQDEPLKRQKTASNLSRLLPNVAVMSVLGISPGRILGDLPVYDFQGYPPGDLQGASDGRGFRKFAAEIPGYFNRLVGFGVDGDLNSDTSVIRRKSTADRVFFHIDFLILGSFASFASAGGALLILYNGKFKTSFRDGYRHDSGIQAPD